MGIRTVRLDDDTERELALIRKATGESVSAVLKQGIRAYRRQALEKGGGTTPYDIYRKLELGQGGWSRASAKESKRAIKDILRRKRGR